MDLQRSLLKNYCFLNIGIQGPRHCFLAEFGRVYVVFAMSLLLSFVVLCPILVHSVFSGQLLIHKLKIISNIDI